jgi:hypothetical protein
MMREIIGKMERKMVSGIISTVIGGAIQVSGKADRQTKNIKFAVVQYVLKEYPEAWCKNCVFQNHQCHSSDYQ